MATSADPNTATQHTSARAPGFAKEIDEPATTSATGIRLGSAFGVEIRVDWSLLIIFALVLFNLGAGAFPAWHPHWSSALSWTVALTAAVLFFGSVLAHELAHAVTARMVGMEVKRITLFLFGGMAHLESEPPSPAAEFAMTIVGPIMSIGIGILATLAGLGLASPTLSSAAASGDAATLQAAIGSLGPGATLLLWLGPINLVLGVFNLVPGFPLDGGRVLRSALWGATGDIAKATRWAAGAGRLVAFALMAIGVMGLFHGAFIQGLWLVLIGWFLNNAAKLSYEQLLVRRGLRGVPVSRIMRRRIDRIDPDLSLDAFVRDHLMTTDQRAFPVERDGSLVGLVCFDDVRQVPHQRWPTTPVAAVMTHTHELASLPADAEAAKALEILSRRDVDQIPVVEGEQLLGLVRTRDLVKWLRLKGTASASASG